MEDELLKDISNRELRRRVTRALAPRSTALIAFYSSFSLLTLLAALNFSGPSRNTFWVLFCSNFFTVGMMIRDRRWARMLSNYLSKYGVPVPMDLDTNSILGPVWFSVSVGILAALTCAALICFLATGTVDFFIHYWSS